MPQWLRSDSVAESLNIHEPLFVNTVGHSIGVLVFGFLLCLLIRDLRSPRSLRNLLPVFATLLALLWNAGSLLVLTGVATHGFSISVAAAFSFASLSLLPAVLFSISLGGRALWLQRLGWMTSAVAITLHFSEIIVRQPELHRVALLLISASFGVLVIASTFASGRSESSRAIPQILGPIALLMFASSFVHFGDPHAGQAWSEEIALHHAGIPLALFIVLQEYRFLLLDAFVRSVASATLAGAFCGVLLAANERWQITALAANNPVYAGFAVVGACGSLILFASSRNWLQGWLTARVFRRPRIDGTVRKIVNSGAASEQALIESLVEIIAKHTGAEHFEICAQVPSQAESLLFPESISALPPRLEGLPFWAEVALPLRFSRGEFKLILLGRRTGGRRYLSEDLRDLGHLSLIAAGRLDRFRSEEVERLAVRAELRALQAQINPHFLFNSLNALYGTIPRQADAARRTVVNLADMFRYFLQTDRTHIALSEEVRIIRAYLEIEQLRLGDRLHCRIEIDPGAESVQIPALSIQPLIENAVRHGVANRQGQGDVSLCVQRVAGGVNVRVTDSGPGFAPESSPEGTGVGLDNVRQRLRYSYGPEAALVIHSGTDGTSVSFFIPVTRESVDNAIASTVAKEN